MNLYIRSSTLTASMQVSKWCIVFACIGAGAIIMGMLQQYGFGYMGQRLTRNLRVLLFESMFRQVSISLPCFHRRGQLHRVIKILQLNSTVLYRESSRTSVKHHWVKCNVKLMRCR